MSDVKSFEFVTNVTDDCHDDDCLCRPALATIQSKLNIVI